MNVREFLRGGYRETTGVTLVLNGGAVALVVFHGGDAVRVEVPERG